MDFVVILLVRLVERMKIVIVIILYRHHDHDNDDDGDDGDEVHLNDHLLLRRVERFWLFPLVDRRGFHRPTGMEPVDIVIFIYIVFFFQKLTVAALADQLRLVLLFPLVYCCDLH